ncbi:MAG: RNA polymerase factor sigma-54 [Prevotellaceae bacterium]|jgi:RNA polymerase sigma-54 factor|nr:RNA polymerase factor sigma-54 [Prevotellaceae bacterium]
MLRQSLQQKQLQKLSPLQIQTIKLLELPLIQLEERIKQELEENPVLEEGAYDEQKTVDSNENEENEFTLEDYIDDDDEIPTYKLTTANNYMEKQNEYSTMTNSESLHQMLEEQLAFQNLDDRQHTIGQFIIGSIDGDGYLRRNLQSISNDIAFKMGIETSLEELEKTLGIIHTFDPPGIGARDLRECLLVQLESKKQTRTLKLAKTILNEHFEEFSRKHYDKIAEKMFIDNDVLKNAVYEILKLNPKPGASFENIYTEQAQQIIPDFVLEYRNGEPELNVSTYNIPELKISRNYVDLIHGYSSKSSLTPDDKETVNFIKQKIDSAKWFIDAVKQRNQTMVKTMEAIMSFQNEYFKTGEENSLRPMTLKDISEMTGLDASTVSRVVNSKYIQCNWGVLSLRYFFSDGVQTQNGEVSNRELKNIILDCISNEDKSSPLTDEELNEILKQKGFLIARRTIAKYREKLNIPVARMRRELK